ncbi:hypothetical protein BYT27DRAFT_7242935 [Phlegmacium glaucopus]|nr:hypothetical protein BYT27DRAFT_7242935 [Phlegmacium glaucopus]
MSSPDFIEIHDEPDIKGSSKTVLEALKALAGRKKPAEDELSWASKWQDLLSTIRIEIAQNRPDKNLENFDFLDMGSKGTFRGPVILFPGQPVIWDFDFALGTMKITRIPTMIMKLIRISTKSSINLSQKEFISMISHSITDYNGTLEEDDPHLEKLPVDFEQVTVTIEPNDRFSLIDEKAWADTLAPKRGFIRLGPKGWSFAVGLYHQIHCVNALRFSYSVTRDGLVTDPQVLREGISHDNYCFQFIRQSIQCRADNTLVPIVQTNRANVSVAAMGFGNMHRCRNWGDIRRFIVENQAKWDGAPLFNETSGRHVESESS